MTTHILMVDDEPDAQELFRQNFRREIREQVYTFEYALSGEGALEILKGQTQPRVVMVLSDINMPGMSGIELLAKIRESWPGVSVFMITAYGDSATETRAHELGAECFLSKPVDFSALKQDLSRIIEATGKFR
jgi:CheY-like chemotaxis protein